MEKNHPVPLKNYMIHHFDIIFKLNLWFGQILKVLFYLLMAVLFCHLFIKQF